MYNTPVNYFDELVQCLLNQTYSNWELCLADGSPMQNKELEKYYIDFLLGFYYLKKIIKNHVKSF